MDSSITRIAEFARALGFADLPPGVVHDCKRRLIDTLACALYAFDAEPCRIARRIALRVSMPGGAHVLGTAHRTTPELAAFANGVMARYSEGNDVFYGGGHPSDAIMPVLAVADSIGADGKAVITAVTLAYEIYHAVFRAVSMRKRGLDHVFYTAVASAVGAAKLLNLDYEQTGNAIALAVTPNIPLHATRRGNLSMWKGCAAGNAGRNGIFAALLAAEGMTGPDQAIDGSHGLRELASRWEHIDKFEITPLAGAERPYRITEASMKCFLSEGGSLSPILVGMELHKQIAIEDIKSIDVYTYWLTWSEIGSEAEKWHPTTREAADHSLPYILAAVLVDGRYSDAIFSAERLADTRIRQLIEKISVTEDPELTRRFPRELPCRIEVTMKNGARKIASVDSPPGHPGNPMSDEEVNGKFCSLVHHVLDQTRMDQALSQLWKLDRAAGITEILEIFDISGHNAKP